MSDRSSPYAHMTRLARMFPAPDYLTMPAMGVDISDYAIKHIMFERRGTQVRLGAHGKIDLPMDVIERGEIIDAATIHKLLARLREEQGVRHVHLSLPEEHAYLFQMDLPSAPPDEVEQMVEFHLKENVPIGADEAVFDFNVLREKGDELTLNVSVYPGIIASQYVAAVREAGFDVLSVEIEGQATARALIDAALDLPTLIIDIGRNDASLSISTSGAVTFTASLETGGDDITRSLARTLDVSFQEAEKFKREHGFVDTDENQHVYTAMLPIITKIAEAIKKHLMYWQMHIGGGATPLHEVSLVVLAGGNANMIGLSEFLEGYLGVPVQVGNVWQNVFSYDEYVPEIPASESLEYATSVGLALRSLGRSA